jgi:hypothetical protein
LIDIALQMVVLKYLLLLLLIYPPTVGFTLWFARGGERLRIVGILCAFNSVCMYASPLSVVVSSLIPATNPRNLATSCETLEKS